MLEVVLHTLVALEVALQDSPGAESGNQKRQFQLLLELLIHSLVDAEVLVGAESIQTSLRDFGTVYTEPKF